MFGKFQNPYNNLNFHDRLFTVIDSEMSRTPASKRLKGKLDRWLMAKRTNNFASSKAERLKSTDVGQATVEDVARFPGADRFEFVDGWRSG